MMNTESLTSSFMVIFFLSIITQYVVEQIKNSLPTRVSKKLNATDDSTWVTGGMLALVVGILVAIFTRADVFSTLGLGSMNLYFDYVITGVLISGGSSLIHDLIQALGNPITSVKVVEQPHPQDTDKPEVK